MRPPPRPCELRCDGKTRLRVSMLHAVAKMRGVPALIINTPWSQRYESLCLSDSLRRQSLTGTQNGDDRAVQCTEEELRLAPR